MTAQRVVLCDDDGNRVERWKKAVEEASGVAEHLTVTALRPDEFASAYTVLADRQKRARRGDFGRDASTPLDDADIVVIDFDLTPAQEDRLEDEEVQPLVGSFGDAFAHLVRCHTDAGFTVVANQPPFYGPTFDLTMIQFSFGLADLNVTDSDLANAGLWLGPGQEWGYRPWHWPRLIDAGDRLRQIAAKITDVEAPLLSTLGLDEPDVIAQFEDEQLEPLGISKSEIEALRAFKFVDLVDERCHFGRRTRHERISPANQTMLIAAALSHWLEKLVLPAQNVLVDAPHLAERRPHLVRDGRWEDLTDLNGQAAVVALDGDKLQAATTSAGWTSRPVWLWPLCPPADYAYETEGEMVFCEDTSSFTPVDEAIEYTSSVAGPWTQRWVSKKLVEPDDRDQPAVEFRPETRFYG